MNVSFCVTNLKSIFNFNVRVIKNEPRCSRRGIHGVDLEQDIGNPSLLVM